MRLGRIGAVVGSIMVLAVIVLAAGVTDAFGTDYRFETKVGPLLSDGAGPDTVWNGPGVDAPGISLIGAHCHGRVQYEIQVGATGPTQDNPCSALMGEYGGRTAGEYGVYVWLPGDRVVYRVNEGLHWSYCVGGPIYQQPAPSRPC